MNNKIATVVVTFNRKDSLLKNIKLLINQTTKIDKIFIIDNASTDGTYEILNENEILKRKDIEYIRLEENLGGSAGFYEGIKLAYEKKYDWIWGMDDDAYPNKNALQQLISMSVKYPDIKCFWSNCNNDNLFDIEVKEVKDWMFVGFFINRKVIKNVGFPRNDFFIYHDDSEYSYRIRKKGYKILKCRDSIIEHGDFTKRNMFSKVIVGKEIKFPDMPDWKLYYYARNGILKYKYNDLNKYKQIYITFKELIILSIVNKKQINIFINGIKDGLIGKTGKKFLPR